MLESPNPVQPTYPALTCLTEVELAMIGGHMARAFLVEDAPWFDDLLLAIDHASGSSAPSIA